MATELLNDGSVKWKLINLLTSSSVEVLSSIAQMATPIGSIITFAANGTLPEGWLICNGAEISKEEFPDLYSAIGDTYGEAEDSNFFCLPDYRGKVLQGSDSAGEIIEAGLPNITGSSSYVAGCTSYGNITSVPGNLSSSGSIYTSRSGSYNISNQGWYLGAYNFYMDASRSNSIYGSSDTVQPPAVTVMYLIKALSTVIGDGSGSVFFGGGGGGVSTLATHTDPGLMSAQDKINLDSQFYQTNTVYSVGEKIHIPGQPNYLMLECIEAGQTGNTVPIEFSEPQYDTYKSNTNYNKGDLVKVPGQPNYLVLECIDSGTSGATPPSAFTI